MAESCILYYITDRKQFPGDEPGRRRRVLDKIAEAARCGVDFIQLREKDLSARELERLAREAVTVIRQYPGETRNPKRETRLLINSRSDIALAVGADGVHLRSDDIAVSDATAIAAAVHTRGKSLFTAEDAKHAEKADGLSADSASSAVNADFAPTGRSEARNWVIAVSCPSEQDVQRAAAEHADFVVFAPVFEKRSHPGTTPVGLVALRRACQHGIPVLALGGVTVDNATSCRAAGAAGIAGIRLFQENDIAQVVRQLRRQ